MDYVENILKIAKENNYTNKQLCELLGKNPSYISDWKSGKSKPKADEIILLAQTFNVSVDYSLGQTSKKHKTVSLDDIESGKFNIDYPNERIDVPIEFSITEDKMKEFFLSPQKFNAILDELKKIVSDSGLSISPSPTQEQRDEFTELLEDCSSSEKELIKSYIKFVKSQRSPK